MIRLKYPPRAASSARAGLLYELTRCCTIGLLCKTIKYPFSGKLENEADEYFMLRDDKP